MQSCTQNRAGRHPRIRAGFHLLTIAGAVLLAIQANAGLPEREQARFIHDRLTGAQASDALLDLMEAEIVSDPAQGPKAAARLAMDGALTTGGFYNAVVKNWASAWTNEAQDVFQPLNDYSATIIGLVRDEADFREMLYGDVIYVGNVSGISPYSMTNNNHYEALEAQSQPLGDPSVLAVASQSSVTGIPSTGVAGVMTTRAAARAFFIDGTNRAMFRFTVLNHLCNDLEQYKDNELPTDRIRQDVSRSPGGDSSIFLNECSACHTGMDAMAGAFAYYQYDYPTETEAPGLSEEARKESGRLVYTPGLVQEKYLINTGNFSDGFITANDHWINYWRTGPNARKIGWINPPQVSSLADEALDPAYSEGEGAASLGRELANTEAFAYCQVKKAFKTICLREPLASDSTNFETIVSGFKSGYNMKQVFIDVAVYCSQ